MKIWAIANQKGGVGKTTSTISLAGLLTSQGYNTLVVDMDPHGSLTSYLGYNPDEIESGVYTLFYDEAIAAESLLRKTQFDRLSLLPASTALATLDRQLGSQSGKGLVLKNKLFSLHDRIDYVLLDCPPMLGVLMVNALAACDLLIVPVLSEYLALKGLERMLRTIEMMSRSRKSGLPYLIVPTMFDRRTSASVKNLATLQMQYDKQLWNSVIPVDTLFREASQQGIPVSIMSPHSRGAKAYAHLLKHLLIDDNGVASVAL